VTSYKHLNTHVSAFARAKPANIAKGTEIAKLDKLTGDWSRWGLRAFNGTS